jgi:hypothetical protein
MWKCIYFEKLKYRAKIHTSGTTVLLKLREHGGNPGAIAKKQTS